MSFNSKPVTQTTQAIMSPEQRQILDLAMPGLQQYAANPPQRFQGPQVAGFDPLQTQGQEQVLGSVDQQRQLANSSSSANQFLLGDALDPTTNPALQKTIDAAVRPIYAGLTEKALPAIRNEAVTTGNFGASRQGIAEAGAIGDASQAAGDAAGKVANQGYLAGLEAMIKGLSLTPQTQGAQVAPGTTTSAVGDVRQAQQQAQLQDQVAGFNYDQQLPFLVSQDLASILAGLPGGGATTTASGPQTNKLMSGLGGASVGASLASALGFSGGSGAGIGALAALLSERFMKEEIEAVGKLANGLTLWSFQYVGEKIRRLGLMADEVEKLRPEAIVPLLGARLVDYSLAMR